MSEVDYNLKESEKAVGQLRKAILTGDGRVVDGIHRLEMNPEWSKEVWEHIKTEEDYWKTRAHLNYSRRNATQNRQEKIRIINSLAAYYIQQGLKVSGEKPPRSGSAGGAIPINEVIDAVVEALKGAIPRGYIQQNIDRKYIQKQKKKEPEPERKYYKGTPEEAIRSRFGEARKEHGEQIIRDLKKEVREEVKAKVKAEAVEDAKEELRKDPEFILDAAESAAEVLPTLQPREVTREGYHKPTLTEQQKEQIVEAAEKVKERKQERLRDPRLLKIGRLNRISTALLSVANVLYLVECPITGNSAETDLIFKESGLTIEEARTEVRRQLEELRRVGSQIRTKPG